MNFSGGKLSLLPSVCLVTGSVACSTTRSFLYTPDVIFVVFYDTELQLLELPTIFIVLTREFIGSGIFASPSY